MALVKYWKVLERSCTWGSSLLNTLLSKSLLPTCCMLLPECRAAKTSAAAAIARAETQLENRILTIFCTWRKPSSITRSKEKQNDVRKNKLRVQPAFRRPWGFFFLRSPADLNCYTAAIMTKGRCISLPYVLEIQSLPGAPLVFAPFVRGNLVSCAERTCLLQLRLHSCALSIHALPTRVAAFIHKLLRLIDK